MRTTVRLDDHLLKKAKEYAASENLTFTALLEQALREFLARRETLGEEKRIPIPVFKGRGLQPGVDLDDSAALLELMENDHGSL